MIIFLIGQRHFVSSITLTGMKSRDIRKGTSDHGSRPVGGATALPPDKSLRYPDPRAPAVEGRVDLDGDRLFALISTYETKTGSNGSSKDTGGTLTSIWPQAGDHRLGHKQQAGHPMTTVAIWFGTVPPRAV